MNDLLELNSNELEQLFPCRIRRKLRRGNRPAIQAFISKLHKAKQASAREKPREVKTHLRDVVIEPAMVGNFVRIHNGDARTWKKIKPKEIQPEMIGMYLGEFSTSTSGKLSARAQKN